MPKLALVDTVYTPEANVWNVEAEKGSFSESERERAWNIFRIFLRDWNDFAAKTELWIVLEDFCAIDVGMRLFLFEDKRGEKLNLENLCPKKEKGERELNWKQFVQVKREGE